MKGYTGVHCEILINNCDTNPCVTGHGVCSQMINGFVCLCFAGWTGFHCETEINFCLR